jgi:hypothetical protein
LSFQLSAFSFELRAFPLYAFENKLTQLFSEIIGVDFTTKGDSGKAYLFDAAKNSVAHQFRRNVIPDFLVPDALFKNAQNDVAVFSHPFISFTLIVIRVVADFDEQDFGKYPVGCININMGPDEFAKLVKCAFDPFEVIGNLSPVLLEIFTQNLVE